MKYFLYTVIMTLFMTSLNAGERDTLDSPIDRYSALLENFTSKSDAISNDDVSDDVKDDVYDSFKNFSTVARSLQSTGMKLGFSISKYLNHINSFIASQKIGWKRKSERRAFNNALTQLEKIGTRLKNNSQLTPKPVTYASSVVTQSQSMTMFNQLRQFRIAIIKSDTNLQGLSYDDETIQRYLKSLSKSEYTEYKKRVRSYISKGYKRSRAKTTAIKMIHSYTLAKRSNISVEELSRIIDKLDLDQQSETQQEFKNLRKA